MTSQLTKVGNRSNVIYGGTVKTPSGGVGVLHPYYMLLGLGPKHSSTPRYLRCSINARELFCLHCRKAEYRNNPRKRCSFLGEIDISPWDFSGGLWGSGSVMDKMKLYRCDGPICQVF